MRIRANRTSGASPSLGVTRYQWPRIMAANDAAGRPGEQGKLGEEADGPEGRAAPGQRTRDEGEAARQQTAQPEAGARRFRASATT